MSATGCLRRARRQFSSEFKVIAVRVALDLRIYWSARLMAHCAGITEWQVRKVWQAADLKPHRLKTFKVSRDPQFAEKVIDVVGLYLNPLDPASPRIRHFRTAYRTACLLPSPLFHW